MTANTEGGRADLEAHLLQDQTSSPASENSLTLWRLASQSRPERCLLLTAGLALLISTMTSLALPILIGEVVDTLVIFSKGASDEATAKRSIDTIIIELAAVSVLGGVFAVLRGYLFRWDRRQYVAMAWHQSS
jgi:ABC-type multidrug transport system fused ATPase/permease subunit